MNKESTDNSGREDPMPSNNQSVETFRVHVTTWNVGGKSPHSGLNLDDLLQVHEPSDIYVLGFQEIVPLNAGNVLVMEDNGPAAKWLSLISQSLNRSATANDYFDKTISSFETSSQKITSTNARSFSFQRTSLRKASKVFKAENYRKLKTCNCSLEIEKKIIIKDSACLFCQPATIDENEISSEEDEGPDSFVFPEINNPSAKKMKYNLIASKQMVGIFVTIWVKKELVQDISHLRFSYVGRGIMGVLGNKGCISVSMSLHQTSFCFICSHLASGEKEGDEIRRNSDVIEILKNTQFTKLCRISNTKIPDKILEHDRVIWFGDLNYRIALSYSETRKLLQEDNWDALLDKDQLKIEREAGRAFKGWKEGKIYFPPTYKYYHNSDTFYGESVKSKKKRRTPAWCDRILWHGNEIRQLYYGRRESRFSDHRPVCATFLVHVRVIEGVNYTKVGNYGKAELGKLLCPLPIHGNYTQ